MHIPEPEPEVERAWPALAKREPHWPELCADIAALSTLEEWDAFWTPLGERLEALPLGWRDVAHDAMHAQRTAILEAL